VQPQRVPAAPAAPKPAPLRLASPLARVASNHRHNALHLPVLHAHAHPMLSADDDPGKLVDKLVAAAAKVGIPITEADVDKLRRAFTSDQGPFTPACEIVSRCFEKWPEGDAMLHVVWMLRWIATQPFGNAHLAESSTALRSLLDRLRGLPDAGRMMGLCCLANVFSHRPGAAMLTSPGVYETVVDNVAEALTREKELERRTAAALAFNVTLGTERIMEEALAVQVLCALFNSIGDESDKQTLKLVLLAVGWVLYGNDDAVNTAITFGFEIREFKDPEIEELAMEVRQLLLTV